MMNDKSEFDDNSDTEYILRWIESIKREWIHNPEAFIKKEPGLYVGGVKVLPGDTFVTDNHGLPIVHRAGTCE
jgi:hypothetical protein